MTVDQAVKKFKLEPLNVYTAKAKAKELNVEEVLYMNVQKNKYAYIVKDGARGYVLYQDEKSIYSKMYKGLMMTPLEPYLYIFRIRIYNIHKKKSGASMQIEVPDFWLFTIFILIEQLHMLYAFIIQFHNYRFRAVFAVVDECVPLLFPVRKAGSVIPDDHIRMCLTFIVKQD